MLPTGFSTVIAFLVVVAPGLVLESRFRRRRPAPPESSFAEANRVVLTSVIASGLSIAAVGLLLYAFHRPWYREVTSWVASGNVGKASAFPLFYFVAAVVFMFAVGGVLLFDHWFGEKVHGPTTITTESAWRAHLDDHHKDPEKARFVVATVETTSGMSYRGPVASFSPDHDWADREVVLCQPLSCSSKELGWRGVSGHFVMIPSSAIVSVTVAHGVKEGPGPPVVATERSE